MFFPKANQLQIKHSCSEHWWPQGWGEGMGVDREGPDQTGREGLHCGDPKGLRGGRGPLLSLLVRKPTTGAEGQSPEVTCRGQSPWS